MQKVPGVSSARVSLNDGLTILDLKPGNTVTLARLREVIKNNGFVSKEATIVARGDVVVRDGQLVLYAARTHEVFALAADAQAPAAYGELRRLGERSPVRDVEVAGLVELGGTPPPRLVVRRFKS